MQHTPLLGPLIVDLLGTELTEEDSRRLCHPNTGGVILFGRNFASRHQITTLIQSIRALRPELIISIDHEGGRVQRFKTDGFTHLPAMRDLGTLYSKQPNQALSCAQAAGYVLASELVAIGVDYSYTPVLDLDYGGSTVIGDRAFDGDAQVVIALATALLSGMRQAGMVGCGKHFPGHGFVVADSHVDMPIDERDWQAIAPDIAPYRQLSNHLGAVMPAHVIYPKIDALPAGFSRHWLDCLRAELHFTGAIITDDLSMAGAAMRFPDVVQRVRAALDAGCDMAMVCNRPQDLDAALTALPEAYRARTSQSRLRALRAQTEQQPRSWTALQSHTPYQNALAQLTPWLSSQKNSPTRLDPTEIMLQT